MGAPLRAGIFLPGSRVVTVIDIALAYPLHLYNETQGPNFIERPGRAGQRPPIVPTAALGYPCSCSGVLSTGGASFVVSSCPRPSRTPGGGTAGAVEEIDLSFEETARTLGARPIQSFHRVLYPLIKSSILAGAIMAFTRSLGETGATQAVLGSNALTAPVYIVSLVKADELYQAGLACIILIIVSYIFMLLLRYLTKKRKEAILMPSITLRGIKKSYGMWSPMVWSWKWRMASISVFDRQVRVRPLLPRIIAGLTKPDSGQVPDVRTSPTWNRGAQRRPAVPAVLPVPHHDSGREHPVRPPSARSPEPTAGRRWSVSRPGEADQEGRFLFSRAVGGCSARPGTGIGHQP